MASSYTLPSPLFGNNKKINATPHCCWLIDVLSLACCSHCHCISHCLAAAIAPALANHR